MIHLGIRAFTTITILDIRYNLDIDVDTDFPMLSFICNLI